MLKRTGIFRMQTRTRKIRKKIIWKKRNKEAQET
jgi:hypothetical protein